MKNQSKIVYNVVNVGVMAALCFLGTFIIQIPVPITNGYIHLGDSMVFLAAVILGKRNGAFAAGIGSMLADLIGGWYLWILPTFIIKALMAFILGYVIEKGTDKKAITLLTGVYITIWAGFTLVLSQLSAAKITAESADAMLTDFEGYTQASALLAKAQQIQGQLLLFALLLPLAVVVILIVSLKLSKVQVSFVTIAGFVFSGAIMMIGYYTAEYIIYGNYLIPIFAIPANMIQFIAGAIIATLLLPVATMIKKKIA